MAAARAGSKWVQSDSATKTAVSVGAADTSIVAANQKRVEVTVCNDSANIIYLALGSAAAINQGVRVNASGGSYTTSAFTGEIRGWATVGASTAVVSEITR